MNVLAALTVLGILIVVHELGHFLAATSQGIRVNGFSVGFGPALLKKELNGVTYALRALPLGGYVSFPDDDKTSEVSADDPDLLSNRPIAQRAFVISAGVLANLLLSWLVLLGQTSIVGIPNHPDPGVMVMAVQKGEAASKAGLTSGDRIIRVNGIDLSEGQEGVTELVKLIKQAPEIPLKLEKIREGQTSFLTITPES